MGGRPGGRGVGGFQGGPGECRRGGREYEVAAEALGNAINARGAPVGAYHTHRPRRRQRGASCRRSHLAKPPSSFLVAGKRRIVNWTDLDRLQGAAGAVVGSTIHRLGRRQRHKCPLDGHSASVFHGALVGQPAARL